MHLNGLFVVVLILLQILSDVRALFKFPILPRNHHLSMKDMWIKENKVSITSSAESFTQFEPEVIETTQELPQAHMDLRGLYATLKEHPTLMDRRLQIGQSPPPLPPAEPTYDVHPTYPKRSMEFDIGLAQPSCPFITEWVRLRHARDINNTQVEVFQPSDNSNRYQWFYTVTCDQDTLFTENDSCPFCCRATNTRRYSSRCIARKSYVMALIRHSPSQEFDWGYIQVDSSCNCALLPRH